ncbi:hypothetical protein K1719_023774 [Acacia pycnantha]|nr:hypothetical protein K1719_023774 [Acacia pycnantha]
MIEVGNTSGEYFSSLRPLKNTTASVNIVSAFNCLQSPSKLQFAVKKKKNENGDYLLVLLYEGEKTDLTTHLSGSFGEMVACFCYASIDLHFAYLPPPKLEFNYDNQDWLQKDEVHNRANMLFAEVGKALKQMSDKFAERGTIIWGSG